MSRRAMSDDDDCMLPLSSPSTKSKYFTPQAGQSKTPTKRKQRTKSNESKLISLVKRKPKSKVKCPMFMSSPSSVYACVSRYNSLLDALHGGDIDLSLYDDVLLICYIHFGACPTFVREFDTIIDKKNINLRDIEEALIVSVRHLCPHECFLRAHAPIREYSFLWRDLTINDGNSDGCDLSSPCRLKKEDLLSGWSCKLLPLNQMNESEKPLVYISPDCKEFNTKSKAIKYMNKTEYEYSYMGSEISLFKMQQTTAPSSRFIDILNNVNPQYSPFGLIEELFLDDPWKLLVSTICLNVTTRAQVDVVLYQFLQQWPDASTTVNANWEEICQIITPLGLGTKRAKGLIRFSAEWVQLTRDFDPFKLTEKQVKSLYGVGQYGWTAYEVFILRRLPKKVSDHALELFVEYQLGRKLETDMQQRNALGRDSSGYTALIDGQQYCQTTNDGKGAGERSGSYCDCTMQTSSTTPFPGEQTKRRKKTLAKVVSHVERAPPRPSSTTSTLFDARVSMHELDEASNVRKDDDSDSDEDSHDKAFYKDLCAKLTERLELVNAKKKKLQQKLNALELATEAKEEDVVEQCRMIYT